MKRLAFLAGVTFAVMSALQAAERPRKFLWAELIAFDNTKPDFGVEDYVACVQNKPDAISLLLLEAALFEKHVDGLPEDFPFPDRACSYQARPYNAERARQRWTARQLQGLVAEIGKRGIETYASFFEWGFQDLTGLTPAGDEPYVDFFIRKTCAFLKDYGFAGLHAADGFAHPRKSLAQRGIPLVRRFDEARRWGDFWKKAGAAFKRAGFKTYLNTCWTRDPYEALVRYGYDYRSVSASDIDGWIVEASSACLELEGWNKTEESSLDKTAAMLNRLVPTLGGKETILMFGVKDDCEQFHSLHHAGPQAEAESVIAGGTLLNGRRALSGCLACLSDGLSAAEWSRLDRLWCSSFAGEPVASLGVDVLWSPEAFEQECRELPEKGLASSGTLLSALIHTGAVVGGAISLEEAMAKPDRPVLVLNPACYPPEQLAALGKRTGKCVKFGYGCDAFTDHPVKDDPTCWLDPLRESRPSRAAFDAARAEINGSVPVVPADGFERVVVSGFFGCEGECVLAARNNRAHYETAQVRVRSPYAHVSILTEYPSVPVEPVLSVKIPPMGVVSFKVERLVNSLPQ